ncbi:MAG: hypothetical protein K8M05_35495 [Deltaproteobacteria bacterium]|nr:hypothetical protein [Kofleriaceae bacterium]
MKPYGPDDPTQEPNEIDLEDEIDSSETDIPKPQEPKNGERRMEGEGSRTADRRYRERLKAFIREGRVGPAAREAAEAVEGPEGPSLRAAEEEGKSRAKVPPMQALKGIARAFIGGAKAAFKEAKETAKETASQRRRK